MRYEPLLDHVFQIEKITVEAKGRAIRADWTIEYEELVCLHSFDPLMYLTSTCHWNKEVPYYRCYRAPKSRLKRNTRVNYPATFRKLQQRGIPNGRNRAI